MKGKKENFLKKKLYRFKKYNQLNFEKVIILGLFLKKEKIKKIWKSSDLKGWNKNHKCPMDKNLCKDDISRQDKDAE